MPTLTKLFMNCFCMVKNAISRGEIIIRVAAQTFGHCISASLDLAKYAKPTVRVRLEMELVTIGMAVKNAYGGAQSAENAMDYAQKLFEERFAAKV